MRLLILGTTAALLVPQLGCDEQAEGRTAESDPNAVPAKVPEDKDIFAVTRWHRTRRSVTDATMGPRSQPAASDQATASRGEDAPAGVVSSPNSPWLVVEPQSDYWTGRFTVASDDVRQVLQTYHRVTRDQWHHSYHHPWGGDVGGWLVLNDGRCVQWMMRPGGLALLRFPDGQTVYLAKGKPARGEQ